MPRIIEPQTVPGMLAPGMSGYMPNCAGESLLIAQALMSEPECGKGVHFIGVWIPGVNKIDYTTLHETARATSFFVTPALRDRARSRVHYRRSQ